MLTRAKPTRLDDPKRLQVLHETGLLDSDAEESFDRLTRLATRLVGAPVAVVSLVDDARQFFKSACGLEGPLATERQTPLSHSFCQYTVTTGKPLIIDDARKDPALRDNLAIPDYNVIAYAGIPLTTPEGLPLGSFCAIDHQPRHWTEDDVAILTDLAASAATEIELRLDIQERIRVENELKQAEKLKDEFVSIVSHELRTPLTALRGSLGLMSSGRLGEEQMNRMLQLAVTNTDRLIRLINDFLDLERMKSGKIELDYRETDLADVIESAFQNVAPTAARWGVVIQQDVRSSIVTIDPDRIVQVVVNLLSNAIKFSEAGAQVCVRAHADTHDLNIGIEDHGRGIPADKLASIFEPFQQVDASDARDKGGTGLGLPICKSIVNQHGGTITVRSELGKGSTFTVVLPIRPRAVRA